MTWSVSSKQSWTRVSAWFLVAAVAAFVVAGFAPARAGASTPASTQSASMDGVKATFTFSGSPPEVHDPRLSIARHGVVVFNGPVTSKWCGQSCWPNTIAAKDHVVHVERLQAGQTLDVVLDLYSGGAHCCSVEQVYSLTKAGKVRKVEHNFGDPGVKFERIGAGGATYFVSADDVFAYAFTDFAASGLPIEILRFEDGSFHDVTRQFPALIARDATQWLTAFHDQASSHYSDSVGVVAAWAADEDMLGHASTVKTFLAAQLKAGHLHSGLSPIEPGGQRFVTALQAFLHKHGYVK